MMLDESNSRNHFLLMPVELIIKLYCQLPSFNDVLALAATSHRARSIWTENTAEIYAQMGPRIIPCERYARTFRQDQAGMTLNLRNISVRDVVRVVHNAELVEETIRDFEEDVVSKVRCRL